MLFVAYCAIKRNPPSPTKKISFVRTRFFYPSRQAWYVIAPKERMASREACMIVYLCRLDYILTGDQITYRNKLRITYTAHAVIRMRWYESIHKITQSTCYRQYVKTIGIPFKKPIVFYLNSDYKRHLHDAVRSMQFSIHCVKYS